MNENFFAVIVTSCILMSKIIFKKIMRWEKEAKRFCGVENSCPLILSALHCVNGSWWMR